MSKVPAAAETDCVPRNRDTVTRNKQIRVVRRVVCGFFGEGMRNMRFLREQRRNLVVGVEKNETTNRRHRIKVPTAAMSKERQSNQNGRPAVGFRALLQETYF